MSASPPTPLSPSPSPSPSPSRPTAPTPLSLSDDNVKALCLALEQSSLTMTEQNGAETTNIPLPNYTGSPFTLLQVAISQQMKWKVRKAAAVQFQIICRNSWWNKKLRLQSKRADGCFVLTNEDKVCIRTLLVEALLAAPANEEQEINVHLIKTFVFVVASDNGTYGHDNFHRTWPTLFPDIHAVLAEAQPSHRVCNAVSTLAKVCKPFEYKPRTARGVLNEVVDQFLDSHLLPLAQSFLQRQSYDANLLKQILKVFWRCTQFYLPRTTRKDSNSVDRWQPWFDVLCATMTKPALPDVAFTNQSPNSRSFGGAVEEEDDATQWSWWKAKKWAVRIMARFFSRYGIPMYADAEQKNFALGFSQTVAPTFLEILCDTTLQLRPSGQFCSNVVMQSCFTFLSLSVEIPSTYQILQPRWNFLLTQACMPTICFTPQNVQQMEENPYAFLNPKLCFVDPRQSALSFVVDMVKQDPLDVGASVLAFLSECLQNDDPTTTTTTTKTPKTTTTTTTKTPEDVSKNGVLEKDGALHIFGSVSRKLGHEFNIQLGRFMVSHVLPEFQSPVPLLRYRACWMMTQVDGGLLEWQLGTRTRSPPMRVWMSNVLERLLTDSSLAVRCEAGRSFSALMNLEGAEECLRPHLGSVVDGCVGLSMEMADSALFAALAALVEQFGDEMEPHMYGVVTALCAVFFECTSSNQTSQEAEEGKDEEEISMLASECLNCIASALATVHTNPDMCRALEPTLLPPVLKVLASDGDEIESLEPVLRILNLLSSTPGKMSVTLWEAFPLVCHIPNAWAMDYFGEMLPFLQNCIAKAPFGPSSFVDLIIAVVAKTVGNSTGGAEEYIRIALFLFRSVLDNCAGDVDVILPLLNNIILDKVHTTNDNDDTRVAVWEVMASAFCYDPHLQLADLERRNQCSAQILERWIVDAEKIMHRWSPLKLTVMGLTSVLQIPSGSMPMSVAEMVPRLVSTAVEITHHKIEEQDVDGDDDDDDDDNFGDGDWEQLDNDYSSPLMEKDHLFFLSDTLRARDLETHRRNLPDNTVAMCKVIHATAKRRRAASVT